MTAEQQSLQAPIYAHGVTSVAALSAQIALLQGQLNVAVLSKTAESTLLTSYQQVTGIQSMVQAFKQLMIVTRADMYMYHTTHTVREAFRVAATELNKLSAKCEQVMEELNGSLTTLQQLSISATSFTAAQQVRSQFAKYGPHGFVQSGQESILHSARAFRFGYAAGSSQGIEQDDDEEIASINMTGSGEISGFADDPDGEESNTMQPAEKKRKVGRPKGSGTPPFGKGGRF